MPAYPFNPSTLHWTPPRPHRSGTFRPNGPLIVPEGNTYQVNPKAWRAKRTVTGRLIVGFNVGKKPKYDVDDLMKIVERVRRKQSGNPSSSFIAQRGIFQHQDGKTVVHEDGAQVFIIKMSGSDKDFEADMVELAEIIADEMKQESVIVEIQVNGISKNTFGVSP